MPEAIIGVIVLVVVVLVLAFTSMFTVKQQFAYIIERFGRFSSIKNPGLRIRIPLGVDKIAAQMPLRIQQSDMRIETKTGDNVFVWLTLAVQFRVNEQRIADAYYKLNQPLAQIQSYVENAIRSAVPKYSLDDAYDKQDDISNAVFATVSEEMNDYGYVIVKTLITSIEPDGAVKQSMNEINAAQRKRVAAQELAEADRIKTVTAARAEAEKDQLHGRGIANERKEIIEGLADQFEALKGSGLTNHDIMNILLIEQYIDMMNNFANNPKNTTVFVPSGPSGVDDLRTQIMSSLSGIRSIEG